MLSIPGVRCNGVSREDSPTLDIHGTSKFDGSVISWYDSSDFCDRLVVIALVLFS